jgi:hypothetical protein
MSLSVLVVLLSIVVPSALAIGFFWLHRKWQERDGKRSPIENKAIFGAGEQLRKRVEDHADSMLRGFVTLFWIGPYFLAVWALQKVDWAHVRFTFGDSILVFAFVVFVGFSVRHILKHGNQRRRATEGLKAELFAAQELNRLMAQGCTVLHDIPADGFNLDHVVIGPKAVYLVETKSVRKPAKTHEDGHKLRYDGETLHFPHFASKRPLQQARRQAEWLRAYLHSTLRSNFPVVATVALPGWWIDSPRSLPSDAVRVFNPAGRGASFMANDATPAPINPSQAGLVAQALLMRISSESK